MPKPIRIMHVVDNLGKGGLENGLLNLIERMDPNRFEHVVWALRRLGANADRLADRHVRVVCMGKREADSPIQVGALIRAIREIGPEIVHSRNWGAVETVFAGRWVRSCAVVHSEHGLDSNHPNKEPWRRACLRRLAFELADRVLSVSYQLRDIHAQRTGFPAHKITVIHNGVDSGRFYPDSAARTRVREELGISDHEYCVGCVGNLFPIKDHMTLLKAVEGLAQSCKDWRLLIAGEGSELAKLQGFANAHEWRNRVSFLGSSDRVPELLNAMDLYVLPSLNEGISNSLLEAMATGLPVAVTATGGNPEVVVDGKSGLLFPVGNAEKLTEQLLLLRARREWRLELGRNAMRRVRQEFSIDSMIRNYEQFYESLVSAATPAVALAGG